MTGFGTMVSCLNFGISGRLLNWFRNYLADRKQHVVINGCTSEFKLVEAGVPQGSIIGPLLFLICIMVEKLIVTYDSLPMILVC